MEAKKRLANFIAGEFVEPLNGKYIDSFNPATGEADCEVPDSDEADVAKAVEAAKKAFPAWAKLTPEQRSKILLRIADLIEQNLESFAQEESRDQGKPVSLARAVDIPRAVANFRFFASAILHHEEASTLYEGSVNYTVRTPLGVAGLISPWYEPSREQNILMHYCKEFAVVFTYMEGCSGYSCGEYSSGKAFRADIGYGPFFMSYHE